MEGLENDHVEDVVGARAIWQAKAIGNVAHTFLHLVRASVARAELAATTQKQ